jgi:hypothetical protein
MATWMEYRSSWIDPHRRHTPWIAFDGLAGGCTPKHSSGASTVRSTKPAGRLKASLLYCPSDRRWPRTEGSAEAIGGPLGISKPVGGAIAPSVPSCDGGVGGGLLPKVILGGK